MKRYLCYRQCLQATVVICLSLPWVALASEVVVEALLPNAAVLSIDGSRHMLKAGDRVGDVVLIESSAQAAVIEIDGNRQRVGLSQRITGTFSAPDTREVVVRRDAAFQYKTLATVNGRQVTVLVDTGANTIALNTDHAKALGVDYKSGVPSRVTTAGGQVEAWTVSLRRVDVGGIAVENVQAAVIEGSHPTAILLGMSFLQHVQMQESEGVLVLSRDW